MKMSPASVSLQRIPSAAAILGLLFSISSLPAQVAPAATPAPATSPAAKEEVVELSPYIVNSSGDAGYIARNTLSGSRTNTALRDVASMVSIMTPEFLQDVGAMTVEDALAYSLNTENSKEFYDVVTNNNATLTNNTLSGNNRTRGLGQQTATADFYETAMPQDEYNYDRVTLVYGPNAILFGSGNPSGNIDISLKRARHNKQTAELKFMTDTNGSLRGSFDLNQPIIKNKLALRVAQMVQDRKEWREPTFDKQWRTFLTAQYDPYKWLNIRGWYENYERHRQPLRNTIVTDGITPWINAGRPIFNNAVGQTLPPVGTNPAVAGYNPVFEAYTDAQRPLVLYGQTGGNSPTGLVYANNTVTTRSIERVAVSPNNFDQSLVDGSLYPLDVSVHGDALMNWARAEKKGFSVQLNPLRNLHIELSQNQENFLHKYVDLLPFGAIDLRVDANRFLPDRVTPNPNVGRYYFESGPDTGTNAIQFRSQRASANYELDFTEKKNLLKWFGRHQLTGFYLHSYNLQSRQRSDFRIINNPASLPGLAALGNPADTLNSNLRDARMRIYVDNPQDPNSKGVYSVTLPFDPFAPGTLPGTDWQVATLDNPFGARDPQQTGKSVLNSRIYSIQSHFLKDRIVTTYGKRYDKSITWGMTSGVTGSSRRTGTVGTNNSGIGNNAGYAWWYDQIDPANGSTWIQNPANPTLETDIKAVVIHPFRWVSAYYNESNTQNPQGSLKLNLDGTIPAIGSGVGKDMGLTFSLLNDNLVVRLNKFELSEVAGISQYRAFTGIGGINPFRDVIHNIERTATVAGGAPISTGFAKYSQDLFALGTTGQFNPFYREQYDVVADKKSTGYELELVANPTRNWRVSLSVAKTTPVETNIAPQWFAFIEERLPVWASVRNTPNWNSVNVPTDNLTINAQVIGNAINSWNFIYQNNGNVVPQTRLYRVNFTTRYQFSTGVLKGFHVGGSARWRDKTALGYGTRVAQASELKFTTGFLLPTDTLVINDLAQPILGPDEMFFDGNIGYERRLWNKRIGWKIQLNIRNLLDNTDRVPQRLTSTGAVSVFTLLEPRTFQLTNTFSF
jgi:iron complex outermembrane receptor protein